MKKVKTKKYIFPNWEAYLFISLFNGDGGDGCSSKEIEEANEFIRDNKLASLVEVEDTNDSQIECTFILMNKEERASLRKRNHLKGADHATQ
jgi:hypothetical protein